jgi:hypothetical protein
MTEKIVNVGTIGHIDHGKHSLVGAMLTALSKPDLLAASERAIERVSAMSDKELLSALDNCEDTIAYAQDPSFKRTKIKPYRTLTYIVYPPNYNYNTDKYHKVDTRRKAFRLALKLGEGAEVYRDVAKQNNRAGHFYMSDGWEVVHGKYFYEFQRNGRVHPDAVDPQFKKNKKLKFDRKIRDVNGKYVPIYRKREA